MIRNIINNKIYIGQSHDIYSRWTHHKCDLNNNQHHNRHLQSAWNYYGSEFFEFSIIEETNEKDLDIREMYWIEYYSSYTDGYNNDTGGQGCHGFKHTDEQIMKMRKIQNPYVVLQFDTNKKLVNEWVGGISHVSKVLGYSRSSISIRCTHKIKHMSLYKNYYWVFKEEYNCPDFTWDKYLNNETCIIISKKDKITRKINQYTLNKEFIKTWNSLSDIRKKYGNVSGISAILYHRKGKKTAYGYIWAFDDYDFSDGYFDVLNNACKKRMKKISKIDPTSYDVIDTYNSLTEAVMCNDNISSVSNISAAAKGFPYHKCGGFLWEYI